MNIPAKEEEGSYGRMLNQQWVPYCSQYKSIVYFFRQCLPVAQFIFFEKEMDDAKTQNLGPVMHTLGMYK